MALLSLQQIHKTFEKAQSMKITSFVVWISTLSRRFYLCHWGNGAGKSTLMNSIAGVLSIDEGISCWRAIY